jgi:protein-disulfide isomerase
MKLNPKVSLAALLYLVSGFLFVSHILPVHAEPPPEERSFRKELDQLIQAQRAIEKELREIKVILQRGAPANNTPPQNLILGIKGNPFKGREDAKLTLVEFSDYECPFCRRYFEETWPKIQQEFITTGKIKYVLRDFPIESMHQNAFKAAEAASCAGKQGKYWEMHDRLFQNQNQLGAEELPKHAEAIGLTVASFQECLNSGSQAGIIRKNMEEGMRAGVQGTPTFFLGVQDSEGKNIKVIRAVVGAQPFASFKEAIDSVLNGAEH